MAGCFPSVRLLPDAADPLKEYVLEGQGRDKVVIININGVISDKVHKDFMSRETPSLLQEVIAQFQMAKKDPAVKAVILKIDSPGGTVTASDILYRYITDYKQATGVAVVTAMMNMATSGGYYIALPSDEIIAHPTTVTGSIGVIFMTPKVYTLLDKIGVDITVRTSGKNKDMGSPLRESTKEEEAIFNHLIENFAARFLSLVKKHRGDRGLDLDKVKSARIFTADEAQAAGLIDGIGYLEDAIATARRIAKLPENARVICYRRTAFPNDNIYNTLSTRQGEGTPSLVNLDLFNFLPACSTGFYYLWWPSYSNGDLP
jgi:protease-4